MIVNELFSAVACPANTATPAVVQKGVGGFLCTTSGTLTVVVGGVTLCTALAVTAGVFHSIPFACDGAATFTTAGGAVGTMAIL